MRTLKVSFVYAYARNRSHEQTKFLGIKVELQPELDVDVSKFFVSLFSQFNDFFFGFC